MANQFFLAQRQAALQPLRVEHRARRRGVPTVPVVDGLSMVKETETETDLQRRIEVELSTESTRMFRNTVGEGWHGRTFTVVDGRLIDGSARRVSYGLGPDTSDLVGVHSVIVTPAMVGMKVGLFTVIEVKRPGKYATPGQKQFIQAMRELGALGGIARSIDDAKLIITSLDR